MSSSLIRQDVLPVGVGYLLTMGALGTGLWLIRRQHGDGAAPGSLPDPDPDPVAAAGSRDRGAGAASGLRGQQAGVTAVAAGTTASQRPGWLRLARHYAGTATGGYLLLMAIVILYYYGVARVGGAFIASAFTGCALLIALATPVFAIASWLTVGRRDRVTRRRDRAARRDAPRAPGP